MHTKFRTHLQRLLPSRKPAIDKTSYSNPSSVLATSNPNEKNSSLSWNAQNEQSVNLPSDLPTQSLNPSALGTDRTSMKDSRPLKSASIQPKHSDLPEESRGQPQQSATKSSTNLSRISDDVRMPDRPRHGYTHSSSVRRSSSPAAVQPRRFVDQVFDARQAEVSHFQTRQRMETHHSPNVSGGLSPAPYSFTTTSSHPPRNLECRAELNVQSPASHSSAPSANTEFTESVAPQFNGAQSSLAQASGASVQFHPSLHESNTTSFSKAAVSKNDESLTALSRLSVSTENSTLSRNPNVVGNHISSSGTDKSKHSFYETAPTDSVSAFAVSGDPNSHGGMANFKKMSGSSDAKSNIGQNADKVNPSKHASTIKGSQTPSNVSSSVFDKRLTMENTADVGQSLLSSLQHSSEFDVLDACFEVNERNERPRQNEVTHGNCSDQQDGSCCEVGVSSLRCSEGSSFSSASENESNSPLPQPFNFNPDASSQHDSNEFFKSTSPQPLIPGSDSPGPVSPSPVSPLHKIMELTTEQKFPTTHVPLDSKSPVPTSPGLSPQRTFHRAVSPVAQMRATKDCLRNTDNEINTRHSLDTSLRHQHLLENDFEKDNEQIHPSRNESANPRGLNTCNLVSGLSDESETDRGDYEKESNQVGTLELPNTSSISPPLHSRNTSGYSSRGNGCYPTKQGVIAISKAQRCDSLQDHASQFTEASVSKDVDVGDIDDSLDPSSVNAFLNLHFPDAANSTSRTRVRQNKRNVISNRTIRRARQIAHDLDLTTTPAQVHSAVNTLFNFAFAHDQPLTILERQEALDDSGALLKLLHWQAEYLSDTSVQSCIAKTIAYLRLDDRMPLSRFSSERALDSVLASLQLHMGNMILVRDLIFALDSLCRLEAVRISLVPSAGVINMVGQCMEKHANDRAVMSSAIRFLAHVSVRSNHNKIAMVSCGALLRALAAGQMFPHDQNLHTDLCLTLRNVTVGQGMHFSSMPMFEMTHFLLDALVAYGHITALATHALTGLFHLSNLKESSRCIIRHNVWEEALVNTAMRHPCKVGLQTMAMAVLAEVLSVGGPSAARRLVQVGALRLALGDMHRFVNRRAILYYGALMIRLILQSIDDGMDEVRACGGVERLLDLLYCTVVAPVSIEEPLSGYADV